MQGLHHHPHQLQQHQLAALLSVALPKDDSSAPSSTSSSSAPSPSPSPSPPPLAKPVPSAENDESTRLGAISSLHRAILFPPNSLLVAHSAAFLSQGLLQLLSDKSYSVRQLAATAYGALCAVACSIPITSNGRQNHVMLGTMVDRFINWSLPLLSNINAGDGMAELALDSLREFLNVGDVNGIERYALPILKACQQLLEDERTSLSLLHRLLGIITLISLKFSRCFQPHFVDIVDLLLGWALIPDFGESDRRVIMDCFLQCQKHWVSNLQFSLGLMSKFLGDMDVLLQDGSLGTPQQFRRLLALLSCFSTILQSTASGLLEANLLGQIREPLSKMLPLLLSCLSLLGQRFGWSKWIRDLWKCLTLLAEILRENFSTLYPLAVDTLFQSVRMHNGHSAVGAGKISSFQVHGVLKTNLQLLSLQKLGLLSSSVHKILQFHAPVSQLRLHPNHVVTASCAATYVFLLQHGNKEVVQQAMDSLLEELDMLKGMLKNALVHGDVEVNGPHQEAYSKLELFALIKFDLKVLLTCVLLSGNESLIDRPDVATLYVQRSETLACFLLEHLYPLSFPIEACVDLQISVVMTLERLSTVEFLSKYATGGSFTRNPLVDVASEDFLTDASRKNRLSAITVEHLRKYCCLLVKALHVSSPLAVKLAALEWVRRFCENILAMTENLNARTYLFDSFICTGDLRNLIFSVLDAASDKEPKVRSHVAFVLELLLKARLLHPVNFPLIAQAILERLGDPEPDIKTIFTKLLCLVLPTMVYSCGLYEYGTGIMSKPLKGDISSLHWKQLFALKQLPQQLQAQQLVSILSYILQRWKIPLSGWVQRLIHSCRRFKDASPNQLEEIGSLGTCGAWLDIEVDDNILEEICSVNVLAGAWWAIHEAARYCVSTRLRTNLGGPSQTFAALERMLLDVVHVLQLDSEQNDVNLSMINTSGAHLLPMRLLLEFVESLKKNIYNAYEGSAVLPSITRQSSLFFRANKKVCEEWFSRICEPMMNAGLALNCHYATIQYCVLRLHELRSLVSSALKETSRSQVSETFQTIRSRFSEDIQRVLHHMALALCRCHEPEALVGLQMWVSMTFSSLLVEENQFMDQKGALRPLAWITGLVYQAEGQYEKSAAHFTHLLQNEESLSSMGSAGVQFAIARIIESYSALSDWRSLESWLVELQMLRARHAGKSYAGALTTAGNEINAIHALAHFDEGEHQAAWASLDLTPKSSSDLSLDPKVALLRSEQMLLQAMLLQVEGKIEKLPHDLQKSKQMLEEALSVLPFDGLTDAAAYATQLHCIFEFERGFALKGGQDECKQFQSILSSYIHPVQHPLNLAHQDCYPWLKVLRVYRTIFPDSPVTLNLCMNLLRLARKQQNIMLAHRLKSYLIEHVLRCSEERLCNSLKLNLEYEGALLMYAEKKYEDAFSSIWSIVRPCMISSASKVSDADESILKAKACLKLSGWLQCKHSDISLEILSARMQADFEIADSSFIGKGGVPLNYEKLSSKRDASVIIEEIVGTATKLSTRLCPLMGKSWISYGSWCFDQARNSLLKSHETALHSCSLSPFLVPEVRPDRLKLNDDEVMRAESMILRRVSKLGDDVGLNDREEEKDVCLLSAENLSNVNLVKALLQQVVNIIEVTAGAPGAEDSATDCLSGSVVSRLRTFFVHANIGLQERDVVGLVDELIDIWWSLRRRNVSLFGYAAHGFIQYLSYASSNTCNGELIGSGYESLKHKSSSYTLRATLYVLHILLNYGVELKENLEPSLSAVPLFPWQEMTPQLFARLSSHPEQVVRRQLQSLLMMLGKRSPWSIVYPTLVDVNANEEKPSEELEHVLGCLLDLHPKLIQDVQLMINELSNVTVLWEELWLSTLHDLHSDVMRRIHILKEEAARIAENITLSQSEKSKINAAKYSAMMAPVILTLERRLASTTRKPVTPHEMRFHEQYIEQLKSAILTFKNPPKSAASLADVWRPFDTIAASLTSYQRKSSVSLGEVAPQLALLSSSDVPMPGLEKLVALSEADGGLTVLPNAVTISSFSEQVTIISTKTKPKKINIIGSDGQSYPYLLKGREDLRLDARIMQLLHAIDSLLHSSRTTRSHLVGIRHYSVTPISGRAGLIQWVDNVISVYSVYKCWQARDQAAVLPSSGTGNTKTVPPPVPRPSDMFYGKIIPALKEKGIRRVISRKDWPHEVKRKVLTDLMQEVPRQLLYQELWCASEGFKAFNLKLKRYSGSVAAMSMVGHILGLGDRHLDNILVDFRSGDILHIDYNICFDKGLRLKIPEIVPFRLTQMIEAALGLTGVEGIFKVNCEAVLGVLRKNKDILLMLLEVFVWDPLVEWTRGDFHDDAAIGGEERKGMESAVSLSLFASRVQEIRVPLQEHHDLLISSLPAVESALERFSDVINKYELVSALFCRADQERSNLILHETSAKSILAEASCNSEKFRASFEIQAREFSQAKALVAEKAQEATSWIEQHGRIIDALRGHLIPEINAWNNLSSLGEALSLSSAVLVAGVPLTVVPEPTQVQCTDLDRELSKLVAELDHGVSSSLTAIQVYSLALQRILPLNYLATSTVYSWAQILQLCSGVLTSDIISIARRQAAELISKLLNESRDSVKHTHDDLCLKVGKYAFEIGKVEDECAELENSVGSEAESKAKDRLLSSFMKYMQSATVETKDDLNSLVYPGQSEYDDTNKARYHSQLAEKKEKAFYVLNLAVASIYDDVKKRILDMADANGKGNGNRSLDDSSSLFGELEELVEKCSVVSEFMNDLRQFAAWDVPCSDTTMESREIFSEENWASIFKSSVVYCKSLVDQLSDVLPDVIRNAVTFNSEFADVFGSVSQVRGTIDSALEQLLEVEMERGTVIELERNYFVKVALITERQLALEEAALKGRDHLSWEEAEELASQEESCRAQLDQLHQSWNQRDKRTSSLIKIQTDVESVFSSCQHHFQSLMNAEDEIDSLALRGKALLSTVVNPFHELESLDKVLSSVGASCLHAGIRDPNIADCVSSGQALSEKVWKFGGSVKKNAFFIWKICVLDSFLDVCTHEVALSMDQKLGFDQLVNAARKKLVLQLEKHIGHYLKDRMLPIFMAWLAKMNDLSKQLNGSRKELVFEQSHNDLGAVRKVRLMLEEYCNAHETARAARSAVSLMKRQVHELKENAKKDCIEIVQMEWMHDILLTPSPNGRITLHKLLASRDNLQQIILNLNRQRLLEVMQSAVSRIARTIEGLQAVERTSLAAEGQLERAMGWACGGSSSGLAGNSSSKMSNIPPEFHEHLTRRRQLLWDAREKASEIIKICMSILEFEASRDGIFWVPGGEHPLRTGNDCRAWQQANLSALTRLDVTYHSFTRIEQEWMHAQSSTEAASNGLFSTTNELCIASRKAKTASDELQSTILAMRDCAYEASIALSAFGRVSRGHTALTSESGSMLEEVLAITEDLHDVHSLGKEAASMHHSLVQGLMKANAILLPLESILSKDVTAMTDAITMERESKIEISPIHGQAIYQSYHTRIGEACQALKPLLPELTSSVKGLLSLLTKLARTASLHAGNLHKALEGAGGSQEENLPGTDLSRPNFSGNVSSFNDTEGELPAPDEEITQDFVSLAGLSLQDKGWVSPPDSIYTSSLGSSVSSPEASIADSLNDQINSSCGDDEATCTDPSYQSDPQQITEIAHEGAKYSQDIPVMPLVGGTTEQPKDEASTKDPDTTFPVYTPDDMNKETELEYRGKNKMPSSRNIIDDGCGEAPNPNGHAGGRVARGKNAYALSVLRRIEMKLDGRDIDETREVSTAEQVDYLIKQATSVDNLCNMYEGWTPWI
ncbi:uncharacterized protein LOC115735623 [Rhodamnia argentea]|uniref:non-specific serine/threonine protein kinase n=1 Tax=Rhodamnia argentea TaxID=178133 RepID=A0A8B8NK09_9MYRT|nr:uncharacterized protein LOC115735623 [Rhodamnia argentea]